MQKPWLDNPDVKRLDPIWTQVRREAEETSTREPVLASLIYATILSEPTSRTQSATGSRSGSSIRSMPNSA